jgi:DNA-binding NarL/FixJ family response regulator
VARGARNKQIAAELTISEFTVKRHVQNILHKLDLPSRRAAAALYSANVDAVVGGQRVGV